jgi:uncharacterized membrane protein YhaH (DUF805 family)
MTFGQSISTCFAKYATFKGRASRSEFWWFILFSVLVQAACGILSDKLSALASLALLLPTLAVGARRAHDIDRSGWWQLLNFLPIIGWLVLLYWYCQRGEDAANRFGEAPADDSPDA